MKKEKEELDEFFKSGLTLPEVREVDEDWDRMKVILLKNEDRKKYSYYTVLISSFAAVLLLIFSLMFYSGMEENPGDLKVGSIPKSEDSLPRVVRDKSDPEISSLENSGSPRETVSREPNRNYGSLPAVVLPASDEINAENDRTVIAIRPAADTAAGEKVLAVVNPAPAINDLPDPVKASNSVTTGARSDTAAKESRYNKDDERMTAESEKSRFSLSLNLSPDLSGVRSMQNTRVGYSVGASLMYNITDKLGIETGIAYGIKSYATDFSNYRPNSNYVFPVKPYEVDADCEVVDLQLNLAYKLLNTNKYSLGFGAGISSYLMLEERYTFRYANTSSRGPRRYNIENQNKHYLGVAALNLSYQRKLANNISLAFNPFLKLPLTDIGYGNIRLRSAGMSIGVITNFNKSKK